MLAFIDRGGTRLSPHVDIEEVEALSLLMTLKNAIIDLVIIILNSICISPMEEPREESGFTPSSTQGEKSRPS